MDIKQLAERERIAEANRKTADAEWRQAWWDTTYALGAITDSLKRKAAVNLVAKITGTGSSYVGSRAKTGAALRGAGVSRARARRMPPRMTLELVRSPGLEITNEVVDQVIQAEKDGKTLREFFREFTGKAWADTPAGASLETIEQIVAKQPELVGQLVARHDRASQAHDSEVLSQHERSGIKPPVRPEDWNSAQHVLTRLTLAVKELRRECNKPGDLTEDARSTIEWALAELTSIKEGREFVGEIEAWLEGSTA